MSNHTLIIAEAGVNHNGNLEMAKELIDVADEAGADYVKFQTFRAERISTRYADKASYQIKASNNEESQYDMLKRLEISEEYHRILFDYCKGRSINIFSTGFDVESLDLLINLEQKIFKIPSGEITNLPYLRRIGEQKKPVLMSTGMATLGEIEDAITALEKSGMNRESITILHCTTEYPAPFEEINLKAMLSIRNAFNVKVGYSDHSSGIEVAIAAVSLGAMVIEKHFTLDRTLPGPDHKASLEPNELQTMIKSIRNIELALGDGVKKLTKSEQVNKAVVRKSLVASCHIKEGETFTPLNVTAKRPGSGISPMHYDQIIGTNAKREFEMDELIEI